MRKLGELLDDDEDLAPQLAAHQRQPQVLLVLVAIADGERLGIRVEREHDQELALAARLEAEVVRSAGVEDLLDHLAHLVHLGGVHAEVLTPVSVLGDGVAEDVVELFYPAAQQVLEAHHAGKSQLALADVVHDVHQIDRRAGLAEGVDGEMALRIDAEVPRAPARNVVQLQRPLDGPVGIRH